MHVTRFFFFLILTLFGFSFSAHTYEWSSYPPICQSCPHCCPPYGCDGENYAERPACYPRLGSHILTLGPEIYYVCRTRQGGTRQHGNLIGARATYDFIKRYNIYVGGQAFYGTGTLKGHTGDDDKIRSRLADTQIEGSLGYTFQSKYYPYYSFTPYGGYGYFREKNKFKPPSPLAVTFTTQFPYFAFGFLSSTMLSPCLKVGLNARFRYMWHATCKVSNDPDFDDLKQVVGNRIQYRIEAPLVYCSRIICSCLEVGIVPFYEQRCYGGRENFPFDFFETKLRIFGVNFQFLYQF